MNMDASSQGAGLSTLWLAFTPVGYFGYHLGWARACDCRVWPRSDRFPE